MDYLVNLNLNKNELQNAVIQPLATNPSSPVAGQIYYHSGNKKLYIYNGSSWVPVGTDQVQADWAQTTTTAIDYIKNKPTLGAAAEKAVDSSISNIESTNLPTSEAVADYVDDIVSALPEPMVFKGTLGTGGTITSLPAASIENTGFTYKVITEGTYAGQVAKAGDAFISTGNVWELIPSGDEPSGTVTNIATGTGLTGGPITDTGTISHADIETTEAVSSAGLLKITTDGIGHIKTTAAVQKADITSILGNYVVSVNGSSGEVTINNATQIAAGLMSATDKTTLDNLSEAAQNAITATTLTIAQGQTSVSASSISDRLITYQAYQSGEAVIVDYNGSAFSIASAAESAITIKCIVTVQ